MRPAAVCLMVTKVDRLHLAREAAADFFAQDYAPRRLVVVADLQTTTAPPAERFRHLASGDAGPYGLHELMKFDDRLADEARRHGDVSHVVVDVREGTTLGDARNVAVAEGVKCGSILVQWDDDDRYAPGRISRQVAALEADPKASCSCLTAQLYHFVADGRVYWVDWHNRRPKFDSVLIPGTIAVHSAVASGIRYPPLAKGEDGDYLRQALAFGPCAPIGPEDAPLYVRRYTGLNTWARSRFLDNARWMGRTIAEVSTPEARRALAAVDFGSDVTIMGRNGPAYPLARP